MASVIIEQASMLLLLAVTFVETQKYNAWSNSSALNWEFVNGAVGYSSATDTIWLLGTAHERSAMEFNELTHTITAHSSVLQNYLYGYAQFWTQIDQYLYMIDPYDASSIVQYDLDTSTQQWDYQSITIPIYTDHSTYKYGVFTCLTSINVASVDYLVVLGGTRASDEYASMNETQIISLNDYQWQSNVPGMLTPRHSLACITHANTIYAIGGAIYHPGSSGQANLKTVETLTINDMSTISSNTWYQLNDAMTRTARRLRAVKVDTDILIFMISIPVNINVIDTITNTISSDALSPLGGTDAAPIVANNKIYLFSGTQWSYLDLSTIASSSSIPTHMPTSLPTSLPTRVPTAFPSHIPTSLPTRVPTAFPSHIPTSLPSRVPTVRMAVNESQTPSWSPITDIVTTNINYSTEEKNTDLTFTYAIGFGGSIVGMCVICWLFRFIYTRYSCIKRAEVYDNESNLAKEVQSQRKEIDKSTMVTKYDEGKIGVFTKQYDDEGVKDTNVRCNTTANMELTIGNETVGSDV